jgi:diadenosine tetraphosphate (Ap4A) HIT family hydrolase|tara:strand:- start:509 stop:880 length:372 start_codon:yes stop_codon:yes gene_type:complete
MNDCLFCNLPEDRIIRGFEKEFQTCFLIKDQYPVSPGHALIIPDKHVESWFDLTKYDLEFMHMLANEYKETVECDGWNVGINIGAYAGQTIFHMHMHLIPRYEGDMENPRGGVRHIIPGKGYY